MKYLVFLLFAACSTPRAVNLHQVIKQDRQDTLRCVKEICKDTKLTEDCMRLIDICE